MIDELGHKTATSELTLRPLALTDLSAVAAVHIAAFRTSALSRLGPEAVRRYYEWQMLGPHDAAHLGVWGASGLEAYCVGGLFRGAVSGFVKRNRLFLGWRVLCTPSLLFGEASRQRLLAGARGLVHRQPPHSPTPERRATPGTSPIEGPSFGILSIAVDPSAQRGGHGRRLLAAMEVEARRRQCGRMNLTVSPENRGGVAFYERLGWLQVPAADGSWQGAMIKPLV